MTTLILPPRFSDDTNILWRAAIGLGWNIERLQSWRVPESLVGTTDVAIYGESLWANFVAQQLSLRLFEPPLDWLAKLPPQFLGRDVGFCTLQEAREKSFPLFVKPAGEKSFAAQVYDSVSELPFDDFAQETVYVLTSEVVQWKVEYRFWILDEQIVTGSSYWRGENSTLVNGIYQAPENELQQARDFTQLLLRDKGGFAGNGAVIDVGIIEGKGWAVVEANPAFGSGIYGSEPEEVLKVVKGCVDW